MMISERIQNLVHKTESGPVVRTLWALVIVAAVAGLTGWYDLWDYHGFNAPEAMDAAQIARNMSEGHGYTSQSIQPFSLYILQKKQTVGTQQFDLSKYNGYYPDLAIAPVYPTLLAGLMKVKTPDWTAELHKKFWSSGGRFLRYAPEFYIAIFNQFLLMAAVVLTFFIAKKLFDNQVAWLAALFTFVSNPLWKFSISGLSTMLLLVIMLGLVLCLLQFELFARAETPSPRRLFGFAIAIGVLLGLGLLTRYAFGFLAIPAVVFIALFGGERRVGLALVACLTFGVVIAPWLIRNYAISHSFFGSAGYAMVENTDLYPGTRLLQSSDFSFSSAKLHSGWTSQIFQKSVHNLYDLFDDDIPHLGGWAAILFFAGLLLNFRNPAAQRLRYFILMSLAVLALAQAMGETWLYVVTPDYNSENLLVLLTPFVIIFGVAFFVTLLEQIPAPAFQIRALATVLLGLIFCVPFIVNFLPPAANPLAYPPYYPPEIQAVSGWMQSDELMMSDMPWAVSWYGRRPCIYLSKDTKDDFFAINDYIESIKGLYLTKLTLDDKFLSNVARGDENGWPHFVLDAATKSKYPDQFPLQTPKVLDSGLFFADHVRWPEKKQNQ